MVQVRARRPCWELEGRGEGRFGWAALKNSGCSRGRGGRFGRWRGLGVEVNSGVSIKVIVGIVETAPARDVSITREPGRLCCGIDGRAV